MAKEKTPEEIAAENFKPAKTPATGTPEYEHRVNTMRDRIVQTYMAATPHEHQLGERFYAREAHGAARALAHGINPDSEIGRVMRETPHHQELATDAAKKDAGWGHSAANPKPPTPLGEHMAERVHRAAGVLARTSPQTPWDLNVTQAHEAYHIHEHAPQTLARLQAGEDRDPENWEKTKGVWKQKRIQVLHENGPNKGKTMALGSQSTPVITAAHAIAMGHAQPEEHIAMDETRRVKIGTFAHNIEHPDSPHVTVDFRAHDIAEGQRLPTSAQHGLTVSGNPKNRTEPGRRYDLMEEAHNRAAEFVNEHHPERRLQRDPLSGKQMQAVTWWADRNDQKAREGGVAGTGIGAARAGMSPVGQGSNGARGRAFSEAANRQSIEQSRSEQFQPGEPSPKRAYGAPAPKKR